MSAGLDNTVRVWDVRYFGDNRTRSNKTNNKGPQPIVYYDGGKSINSSYFSPSGQYAVATTMSNKLDIFENIHVGPSTDHSGSKKTKNQDNDSMVTSPIVRKYHDNVTGRWLSTFMACYHPYHDIFVVGSMDKPRAIEVYDGRNGNQIRAITGEAITSVSSRCCFHPCPDRIMMAGGNSSGRVTVIR
jgi:WD40 repeat protein